MTETAQAYETLSVEHRDGVDWLTLDRPEQFNALNGTMMEDLLDYFGGLYFDHRVRVVVLRGAGKHFCAGLDLQETAAFTNGIVAGARGQRRVAEIILRMRRCPQPVIALVHGAATGAGLAFALPSTAMLAIPIAAAVGVGIAVTALAAVIVTFSRNRKAT